MANTISMTVDAHAIRYPDHVSYNWTATGHLDGIGTMKLTSKTAGSGTVRCNGGKSGMINFTLLSNTSGYGSGAGADGETVQFVYVMDKDEGATYLALK